MRIGSTVLCHRVFNPSDVLLGGAGTGAGRPRRTHGFSLGLICFSARTVGHLHFAQRTNTRRRRRRSPTSPSYTYQCRSPVVGHRPSARRTRLSTSITSFIGRRGRPILGRRPGSADRSFPTPGRRLGPGCFGARRRGGRRRSPRLGDESARRLIGRWTAGPWSYGSQEHTPSTSDDRGRPLLHPVPGTDFDGAFGPL